MEWPQVPLGCSWFSSPLCHVASAPWQASCCCDCPPANAATWLDINSQSRQQNPWSGLPPLPCYHPAHPVFAPCWLQLRQEGLHIPITSPHTGHVFQIPAGDRAEDIVTVFSLRPPGLLRRALLGQVPTTTFEQLQTPQLGLKVTLSSDLHHTCAVGWTVLVLGYFGQLNHYLFRARLL